MDQRCPRQLKELPDSWCFSAVMRLKAIRGANRELSEDEESRLPGCEWCIGNQLANYCFFKYVNDVAEGGLSDIEIASMLNISVDTVRKVERTAISKMRKTDIIQEVKEVYDGDKIMIDSIDESCIEVPRHR